MNNLKQNNRMHQYIASMKTPTQIIAIFICTYYTSTFGLYNLVDVYFITFWTFLLCISNLDTDDC